MSRFLIATICCQGRFGLEAFAEDETLEARFSKDFHGSYQGEEKHCVGTEVLPDASIYEV
jgi:hypothetical protein